MVGVILHTSILFTWLFRLFEFFWHVSFVFFFYFFDKNIPLKARERLQKYIYHSDRSSKPVFVGKLIYATFRNDTYAKFNYTHYSNHARLTDPLFHSYGVSLVWWINTDPFNAVIIIVVPLFTSDALNYIRCLFRSFIAQK